MKIGIIGCGNISEVYMRDIKKFYHNLELAACADTDEKRAKAAAEKYGIPKGCCVKELLSDPEIQIVINLTPPQFHTAINCQILESGKNVFCEKPFAASLEEAQKVYELASRKNLRIGCAPDTFLGSSLQTCRKLLDDHWIGDVKYVSANMMGAGMETWHPAPENYYKKDVGPLHDMGPYYLTALVALIGPIRKIFALDGMAFKERMIYSQPKAGQMIHVEAPTHYSAVLELEGGVIVSMNISYDIWHSTLPMIEIYGTEGTLEVPDPNMTGGRPSVYRREQFLDVVFDDSEEAKERQKKAVEVPELFENIGSYTRGRGVADLADAIEKGVPARTDAVLAIHIVEAMEGFVKSAENGMPYVMKTTCERPAVMR